jgi:hypothetical protein
VGREAVVGFTPALKGGILVLKKIEWWWRSGRRAGAGGTRDWGLMAEQVVSSSPATRIDAGAYIDS